MRVPRLAPEIKLTMRTWAIVVLIGAWMLVWAGAAYVLIGDRPPTWGYGTTPPVPGETYHTTGPPPRAEPVPRQVPSLESTTEADR